MPKRRSEVLVQQVGARIRAIRVERGLTQADVAERAECDPQTIQRAETGRYGLSLNRLESVARGLGVPVIALFEAVEHEVPEAPWSPEDARVAAAWGRVPDDRREAALLMLQALAR